MPADADDDVIGIITYEKLRIDGAFLIVILNS